MSYWELNLIYQKLINQYMIYITFIFQYEIVLETTGHVYLLHFGVDPLTHFCAAVSDENRAVFIDVDQSCSLFTQGHKENQ